MIGIKLKNITQWHMLLVLLLYSHQILFGIQVCQKIGKKCIQKIIVGNGQITHNFFDFRKFCASLAFFAFIQSIIQENACWWSIITTIYKTHALSSKTRAVHFIMWCCDCYFRRYCIRHAITSHLRIKSAFKVLFLPACGSYNIMLQAYK